MPRMKTTVVAFALAVLALSGCAASSSSAEQPSAPTSAVEQPASTEPAAEPTEQEEAPESPAETQEPAEPQMTVAQEQAVLTAKSYLEMGGFSLKSLAEQLAFEQFSKKDAAFAIALLQPDWNAQAEMSARSYLEMGGFSRGSLIEQLEYEGFTPAQARHGVRSVGL